MDERIESHDNATTFSTLNANSSHWQVEVANGYRDKASFASHHGLLWFIIIPFDLNAPLEGATDDGHHTNLG